MLTWMPTDKENTNYIGKLNGYHLARITQQENGTWNCTILSGEEVCYGLRDSKEAKAHCEERVLKIIILLAKVASENLREMPENKAEQLINDLAYMMEIYKKKTKQ